MLDNNHRNSHCAFAERLVSYLYGEIEAREKIEFEKHLSQCSNCTDEFADFGLLRSSFVELQKEFLTLPTPEFVLPIEKQEFLSKSVSVSTEDNSRLGGLRKLFSFSPTWTTAAAAFAALAICFGLIFFAANFAGNDQTAEKNSQKVNSNGVPPSIEKVVNPPNESAEVAENDVNPPAGNTPPVLRNENSGKAIVNQAVRNRFVARNSAAKIPANPFRATNANKFASYSNEFIAQKNGVNNQDNGKIAVAQFEKMPKLSNIEERDEDSIRLSDLFEEVGADN